ncbi:Uncharacterised protein [Tatumella ptyseos]|uniref:Uncharacterized protein n=1 Tax=Tatumella ptyseos TaxID=82987 RepID=A0A2X5PPH9_9GAMM|nr:Uncharacterised protein [Tatumella ptyseos]
MQCGHIVTWPAVSDITEPDDPADGNDWKDHIPDEFAL